MTRPRQIFDVGAMTEFLDCVENHDWPGALRAKRTLLAQGWTVRDLYDAARSERGIITLDVDAALAHVDAADSDPTPNPTP